MRGNWQKRVETAEARRRETKQRKLKTDEKRVFKGWVHDFLQAMDQYESVIRSRKSTIHMWSDALPSSSPPLLDLLEDNTSPNKGKRGGRARSSSIESEGSAGGGKSDSNRRTFARGAGAKKKVHPRSKAEVVDSAPSEVRSEEGFSNILLCRHHFLYGKCDGSGRTAGNSSRKSGTCKYFHYSSNKYLSLADVLKKYSSSDLETQKVEAALKSARSQPDVDTEGGMDMLYYVSFRATHETGLEKGESTPKSCLSDDVLNELSRTQTPLASLVYVAVDGRLVFDRNQEGGTLPGILDSLFGTSSGMRSRQNSLGSDEDAASVTLLPAAVLEHILTFLPDEAVSTCCQVCRSWNNEIGKARSPHFWLYLLKRRAWPQPVSIFHENDDVPSVPSTDAQSQHEYAMQCRALFQDHYRVLRDIRALASTVPSFLSTSFSSTHSKQAASLAPALNEKEVAFQSFTSRKLTPTESDVCVSLKQWSPNHVLAGYAKDCTLRLFQATSMASASRLGCREIVCYSIDPYKSTRKRTCTLDAVGLDDTTIGCLCHVSAQHLNDSVPKAKSSAFILVVLSRDNFLVGESTDAVAGEGLEVIDVGEAVLNFILSMDVVDHRLLPLFDYLQDSGGEVGHVTTSVSRRNIASCGYGRFMVEVSISIPNDNLDDDEENEDAESVLQLDRKLVLFSANTHAIVWMGDSYPSPQQPPPANIPVLVSSLQQNLNGGTRADCAIAATAAVSPSSMLLSCHIDSTGHVQAPRVVENSDIIRQSLVAEGFESFPSSSLLVCASSVVAMETIYKVNPEQEGGVEPSIYKTFLSFFPRLPSYEEERPDASTDSAVMEISGNIRGHSIVLLRDDYIILFCTEVSSAIDEVDGQWFAPPEEEVVSSQVHNMLVVHVPSRREVGRVPFAKNVEYDPLSPQFSTQSHNTIALSIGGIGISMTGYDVRNQVDSYALGGRVKLAGDHDTEGGRQQKVKKKPSRNKKGGSKKDGFARGMSLRG